jgi:hypothetical protein
MRLVVTLLALLAAPAFAQESIYDYQGHMMFGNASEVFTASLTVFGPLTSPDADAELQINVAGTGVNDSITLGGCPINQECDLGETETGTIYVNTAGGRFKSAGVSFEGVAEDVPGLKSYVTIEAVIGPKGDSFSLTPNFPGDGDPTISVSNDTPGAWKVSTVKAPELDPASLGGALTLLISTFLMFSRPRPGESRPTRSRPSPSQP